VKQFWRPELITKRLGSRHRESPGEEFAEFVRRTSEAARHAGERTLTVGESVLMDF
jgi:hypothetical protein